MACFATQAALRHLKGENAPDKIIFPAEIIDKTNYKAWLVPAAPVRNGKRLFAKPARR
jgi:ribose transport system substrate-binding protein